MPIHKYYIKNKEKSKQAAKKWAKENIERRRIMTNKSVKRMRIRLRLKLIKALGGMCSNPSCYVRDLRCLQIHHAFGDGKTDRKRFLNSVYMFNYYLSHLSEALTSLRLLCANCHWIEEFDTRFADIYNENTFIGDQPNIKQQIIIGRLSKQDS